MEDKINHIIERLLVLDSIHDKVNKMWEFHNMDVLSEFPPLYASAKSPITTTELGDQILVEYKGKEKVDLILDDLIAEMETRGFKSPLDVQIFSEKLILSKFNTDAFTEIKNILFVRPNFMDNNPVSISTISMLMGLYLRDKYLEKHPELLENIPSY